MTEKGTSAARPSLRPPTPPLPDAVEPTRTYAIEAEAATQSTLADPRTDAYLVQAVRNHRGDAPTAPLAAMWQGSVGTDHAIVAGAWVEEYELVIAA
ncbi:hypothetical protein [Streptomyces sp. SID3343]|uniref:hypothetical protein n=1 Tax=Streptomyces sp. SID3343 TaxID=2690260 RepID=UPI001369B947|nr:hypothetical protein [Streptomyces sp. SID3343]MYW03030.1 hypothetical protein [Streptomyces sp. SID3343]